MKQTDEDFAAFISRLPVLRRHEALVRSRLHQFAMRRPGGRGDTLSRLVSYFKGVRNVGRVNRAFLKRTVAFADLVMGGANPEDAVRIACRDHPDPYVDIDGEPERGRPNTMPIDSADPGS